MSVLLVFLSGVTLLFESGVVGSFGQRLGSLNFAIFGYLAPLYPCALIYLAFYVYKHKNLELKALQNIFACMVLFVSLLGLQYLWLGKGELAKSVVSFLFDGVGYFGVYFLLIVGIVGAWLMLSSAHFFATMKRLGRGLVRFLDSFGKGIVRLSSRALELWRTWRNRPRTPRVKKDELLFIPPSAPTAQTADSHMPNPIEVHEPSVRVFYDIELKSQGEAPSIKRIEGGSTQEHRDYSQSVIERNRLQYAKLREENLTAVGGLDGSTTSAGQNDALAQAKSSFSAQPRMILPSQSTREFPQEQSWGTPQGEAMQNNAYESSHNPIDSAPNELKSASKGEVAGGLGGEIKDKSGNSLEPRQAPSSALENLAEQMPQKPRASKRPAIVTELSENARLLDSLEKGEVEKPRDYTLPSLDLLAKAPVSNNEIDEYEIDEKIQTLLSKLRVFKIDGDIETTYMGPLVSTFEFKPASHIKTSKITNLSDDLAMALSAPSIRIQAPIPGKNVVGIEVPNSSTQTIYMRDILESEVFKNSASPLTLALGKDIVGNPFVTDLKKLPHLLIAGTTGSGKSVGVNAMIVSLLYRNSPQNLKMIMIDPKMVEFSIYEDIPHLLTPIITDSKKAITALSSAVKEMERRYKLMSALKTKTIENYNQKCHEAGQEPLAFLVIIIDELADLMMTGGKDAEFPITRIAQMGRACGMHLIVATQRPSADVVTGIIKTNLPSRVAFKVSTKIDSRVVLDAEGAQSLLGRGDMLFTPPGTSGLVRLHAPWTSEDEIASIVESIKAQCAVEYDSGFVLEERELVSDEMLGGEMKSSASDLERAKQIIKSTGKTSMSFLQREMCIGYNKAARLIEELEKQGFLSEANVKGSREILG